MRVFRLRQSRLKILLTEVLRLNDGDWNQKALVVVSLKALLQASTGVLQRLMYSQIRQSAPRRLM